MISEWREHRDISVAPIRQGKDVELVNDVCSVGYGWKKPVKVVLVDTLGEEGDDAEKFSGVRAKPLEHGGGERKFDRGREALVMLGLQHARSLLLPFLRQSIHVPLVAMCNCREEGDREGVKVELVQDTVDKIRPFTVLVYPIEGIACGLNRQRWYLKSLAVGRNSGDP